MSFADRLRRVLRPVIPDRVMARLRLRQQSRGARVNVDVVVTGSASQRRWLRTTPDTYRVRDTAPGGPPPGYVVVAGPEDAANVGNVEVVVASAGIDGAAAAALAGLVAEAGASVAVLGETAGPEFVEGRRAEPEVAPRAIALRPSALAEAGPLPGPPDFAPALLERLRTAGHPYLLVPVHPSGAQGDRADAIDGPVAVVLSLVPLHDVGGGSRPAQVARVLLSLGFHVTFVNAYPSNESEDIGLRYLHPRLEQRSADRFDSSRLVGRTGPGSARFAIIAAPEARLARAATSLHTSGFTTAYDMIDDWSGSLGGDWFEPAIERALLADSTIVSAGTPDLVARAAALGGAATLIPNGVDVDVFGPTQGPKPEDVPDGQILGYHGSLWADWFDWDGIATVADAYPESTVLLIGDHRGRRPVQRSNVRYLGLKPQAELGDYVARFDVGLLPRVESPLTHAMSPLKVYEYLAAGVPVAAPPLRSLEGLEGVSTSPRLAEAVAAALAGPRPDASRVLTEHSWHTRVEALLAAAGIAPPPTTGAAAEVIRRPPVHYGKKARRV